MSQAMICDRCGLIMQVGDAYGIWTVNPNSYSFHDKDGWMREASLHLCPECHDRFEREYMANLREVCRA